MRGAQWRDRRERAGLTRREAAAAVGVARGTLRDLERGTQRSGPVLLGRLTVLYDLRGRGGGDAMGLVDLPIIGTRRRATPAQMRARLRAANRAGVTTAGAGGRIVAPLTDAALDEIVAAYVAWDADGLAGDAGLAQSIIETNSYAFGNQVKASQKNPAGLGATNDGAAGGGWPTWTAGIRAQMIHILAWADDRRGDGDYRITAVRGAIKDKGAATSWKSLGGRWAVPGLSYGDSIERIWQAIVAETGGGTTMQQFARTIMELKPGSNRPGGRLLDFDAFVVHETDNERPATGVGNTHDYLAGTYNGGTRPDASFHFCTDGLAGGHSAQFLPSGPQDGEPCWAIGDGQDQSDDASNRTVSGEICVNRDGDYGTACTLMAEIVAKVLRAHGKTVIKDVTVRQHGSYWSARNPTVHRGCPKHLKAGDWGWTWDRFVGAVQAAYDAQGGIVAKQDIGAVIGEAVKPAHPDGWLDAGQPDTFDWPDGEGVIVYRKARYYNPDKKAWFDCEWSAEGGYTPWVQVA